MKLLNPVASTTATTGVFLDGHQAHGDELLDAGHDALARRLVAGTPDLHSNLLGGDLGRDTFIVSDRGQVFEYAEREVVELPRRDLPGLLADGRRRSVDESFGKGAELIFDGAEPIGDLLKLFLASAVRPLVDPLPSKSPEQRRELRFWVFSLTSNLEKFVSKVARDDETVIIFFLRRHGYGHLTYVTGWIQRTPGVRKAQAKETS